MCYNVIKKGEKPPETQRKSAITFIERENGGYFKGAYDFVRRIGLVVGTALFIAASALADGTILGYSLGGVPVEFRSGVIGSLEDGGAVKFARFSSVDSETLAEKIVRENAGVRFATVYKRGSFLCVDALVQEYDPLPPKEEDVISPVDGRIERIVVLRGTPLVAVGSEVKAGDALVGAYYSVEGRTEKTSPVYEIDVRGEFLFSFPAASDSPYYRAAAVALAEEKCPESNIIDIKTEAKEGADGRVAIEVAIAYLKRLGG